MARMITDMIFGRGSPVAYRSILSRQLDMIERERVEKSRADFDKLPLDIASTSGLTVARLRALVRRKMKEFERRGQSLDALFIDYLGLMQASKAYAGQKTNEMPETCARMRSSTCE